MTDKEALDQLNSLVSIHGQSGTAKLLGIAQSLVSMVMTGQREVTAALKLKLVEQRRENAAHKYHMTTWSVEAGPTYIDVDIEFAMPWLDKVESEKVAEALADYCRDYILAFAESRLPQDAYLTMGGDKYPEPPEPPKP